MPFRYVFLYLFLIISFILFYLIFIYDFLSIFLYFIISNDLLVAGDPLRDVAAQSAAAGMDINMIR